jgi:hypothetical protein
MVHDNPSSEVWRSLPLDETEACKQSRLNHKLDPHPIIQYDNLSKIFSLWSLVPKGGKHKGGEITKERDQLKLKFWAHK